MAMIKDTSFVLLETDHVTRTGDNKNDITIHCIKGQGNHGSFQLKASVDPEVNDVMTIE